VMDLSVSHQQCETRRRDMDEKVQRLIKESEERTQREIAGLREDIKGMRAKIDQIPWQLVGMCVIIIGAIVLLAVT
jgi:hypothetical protein